jgi:hypothetical protein
MDVENQKKIYLVQILIIVLMVLSPIFGGNDAVAEGKLFPSWQKKGNGILEGAVKAVAIDPFDASIIYAGTNKAVYLSIDGGEEFRSILNFQGEDNETQQIFIVKDQPDTIFVVTHFAVYGSIDAGHHWQKIFTSTQSREEYCYGILPFKNILYLATSRGIVQKTTAESTWRMSSENLLKDPVYHMVQDDQNIYFTTQRTVIRLNKETNAYDQIFSLHNIPVSSDEPTDALKPKGIQDIVVYDLPRFSGGRLPKFESTDFLPRSSNKDMSYVVLATEQGIYFTPNKGVKWYRVNQDQGVLSSVSAMIMFKPNCVDPLQPKCSETSLECLNLAISTNKGVHFFSHNRWIPVYRGMETNEVNGLVIDEFFNMWASTDRGMFCMHGQDVSSFIQSMNKTPKIDALSSRSKQLLLEDFNEVFACEPNVEEVHNMAIEYAEVHPRKIQQWRTALKRKALFPSISIGLDQARNKTLSDSVYGSYSSGGQHYIAPDDKTFYDNFGWDVSLSWDLGDVVWNSEETSIDSRSKMMVELRQDIIEQITRLYFERRRLQWEMLMETTTDAHLNVDRQMRVAELTALIDGYTGGDFSKGIKKEEN